MKPYPVAGELLGPVLRVAMLRAGGTVHVAARCNNREFSVTIPEDFDVLLAHMREMIGG